MSEVRSRLVSKVAEAFCPRPESSCADCKRRAEPVVRTVCDLIADEIEELDDATDLLYDGGAARIGYRQCRKQAATLVRSLGQP